MPFEMHPCAPKRIALFSGNYNYVMDGPVRALNRLVAFLESQGIEVLVFAPTNPKTAFPHSGTLIAVPSIPVPSRSEYRLALGLPKHIKKILHDFNPDLIHLAAPDLLGKAALKWAKKHNTPAVASFHTRFDTYPRYYRMAWLEKHVTAYMRRFYHGCTHVYAPSACMVHILEAQSMAPDIRVWSRGVDTDVFNPSKRNMTWRKNLGLQNTDVVIAFVGRLVLEKGLGVYADTLDQLKAAGVPSRALIVGEGPERERFAKRLPDAVFTGYLSGSALATAYASSDIFFNASITETFGNVTLEAMASGLPCVCADATGSRSLVREGETGYLIEPTNIQAYTRKITELTIDKNLRALLSHNSFQEGKKHSWHTILSGLLAQYSEAIMTSQAWPANGPAANATNLHAAE